MFGMGAGSGGAAGFEKYMNILRQRRLEQAGSGQGAVKQTSTVAEGQFSKAGEMQGGQQEEQRFGPWAKLRQMGQKKGGFF